MPIKTVVAEAGGWCPKWRSQRQCPAVEMDVITGDGGLEGDNDDELEDNDDDEVEMVEVRGRKPKLLQIPILDSR